MNRRLRRRCVIGAEPLHSSFQRATSGSAAASRHLWTVEEYRGISCIVRDANNFAVAYVYFESEPGRRVAANLMTKDEASAVFAVRPLPAERASS